MVMKVYLTLALLLFAAAGGADAQQGTPYERAVKGAIDRNQRALEGSKDIWEDHSTWENAWQVRSDHYIVRTTHSRKLGRDMGDRLEMMFQEFKYVLSPDFTTSEPFHIFICPTLAVYNQYGEEFGEHHSSLYGSFYAAGHDQRPVIVLFDANETLLTMFTTHSAFHQFRDRAFSRTPPTWIEEGLASYYAYRWAYSWGVSQVRELVNNRRFIALSQAIEVSIDQYGGASSVYFTELGMLFYYLLNFREDTMMTEDQDGACATYLRTLLRGGGTSNLPFHTLITENLSQLEADFKAYPFPEE